MPPAYICAHRPSRKSESVRVSSLRQTEAEDLSHLASSRNVLIQSDYVIIEDKIR